MNRVFIILILAFNQALGQNKLIGKYTSGADYVSISDSLLEFKTSYGCCLLRDLYGNGKYKVHNDSVYVSTGKPAKGHGSSYQVLSELPASNQISIKVQNIGLPVQFCYINLSEKSSSNFHSWNITDSLGIALLENISTDNLENKVMIVYSLGYDHFEIPLKEIMGKNVLVNLSKYEVIQNRQVVFNLLVDSN